MREIKESDWKLFRKKIAGWQENYMEKLNQEYILLLSTPEKDASDKFWELEKRIKQDIKHPGVICEMKRSNMEDILLILLRDDVIGADDITEFSENFQKRMKKNS